MQRLHSLFVPLLASYFASPILAAQQLVFPAAAEGASHGTLPGVRRDFRQQVILADRLLTALRGTSIDAITFRRDGRLTGALEGGSVDMVIVMSTSSRDPRAAFAAFAANHMVAATTVFQGRLAVPASPPVSGTPSFADALQTIRVPLTSAFSYGGGSLVIDMSGSSASTAASLWPIDYATDLQNGAAVPRGTGCGRWASPTPRTMSVARDGLVPGSVVRFVTWTNPNSAAMLMLGAQAIDLDLTPIGATGCRLLLDPLTSVAVLARDRGTGPGVADFRLQLPSSPNLLGAPFLAQWAHLEIGQASNPMRLTTSNAADITLASTLPTLGAALVTSLPTSGGPFPLVGDVSLQRAPVLLLEYHR